MLQPELAKNVSMSLKIKVTLHPGTHVGDSLVIVSLSDLRSGNAEPMTKVTWLWSLNEMVQFHAAAITAVFWYQCWKDTFGFFVGKTCPALHFVDTSKLFADNLRHAVGKIQTHTCRASLHFWHRSSLTICTGLVHCGHYVAGGKWKQGHTFLGLDLVVFGGPYKVHVSTSCMDPHRVKSPAWMNTSPGGISI